MKPIHFFPIIFVTLMLLSLGACSSGKEGDVRAATDSFAVAYFNWQFPKAVEYTTPQSHRWLSFAASQVSQDDVDTLKAMEHGAECEIEDISLNHNDSEASVIITVRNFIAMDTIGAAPHLTREAKFALSLVYADNKWKVDLDGLPRPVRHKR